MPLAIAPVEKGCNANELGVYVGMDEQCQGKIVWPEIDVDPANPVVTEWVAIK